MMKSVWLLLFISPLALADVGLRVRPHVVAPAGSEVKLSQIVDATGISAEGQRQLDSILLSIAPSDGERQELAEAAVSAALRPVVQNERKNSNQQVRVMIPKSVVIDTIKRDISAEQVKSELMQAWQPLCTECKLEIDSLSLPRVGSIRDWTMKIKTELPKGNFSIPVDVVRMNGSMIPAWISGRLIAKKKVPVATRLLNINEKINPEDITWEYRDISFAFDGVPASDEISGRHMKQQLRSGEIMFLGMIEKEKAIHRGDTVTVKSGEGNWEVSMSVVAQTDAYIGDIINMKHPKTNVALVGKVTGQGEVELR